MQDVVRLLVRKKQTLQRQLSGIIGALKALGHETGHGKSLGNTGLRPKNGRKRKAMSEATKAKLRASAKKRWARVRKAA